MAPRLPVDKLMTQREARDALEVILGPQGDLRMSAWFQSYAAIVIPGADVWGAATGEWAATVTLVQKVGHVQAAVMRDEQQSRDKVLYSILLCMVSFAMRGDISQKKLAKFQADLLTTMPRVANLTRDDVALTWHNSGHYIDNQSIGAVLAHWTACLPGEAECVFGTSGWDRDGRVRHNCRGD
ncbi:hypothetical protein CgunFtcFv8_027871 [Champsocephalus gunnari]|nr:hypothetical protein CgunFtcFv8_027871 [Champsocephalus gunnari]